MSETKSAKEISRLVTRLADERRLNKDLVKLLNGRESFLESIHKAVLTHKIKKFKAPSKPKKVKGKSNMTIELMLSDIHVGKKTDNFDLKICSDRLTQLVNTTLTQLHLYQKIYNVEHLIVALIGDIIESQTMHEVESAKGCEFGNSRQIQESIRLLFFNVLVPLSQTGLPIIVPAVTGNHDRTDTRKTLHDPGETNVTYIIYNTLDMLCKAYGLKNVQFHIPKGPYQVIELYGNVILFEHGDNAKAKTEPALEALINKRQSQTGMVIDFLRVGHWHSYACYGRGRIIVNDSVPGADSYSDVMGFNSHAGQTLNFYIETEDRPNCFYSSFPVYLK